MSLFNHIKFRRNPLTHKNDSPYLTTTGMFAFTAALPNQHTFAKPISAHAYPRHRTNTNVTKNIDATTYSIRCAATCPRLFIPNALATLSNNGCVYSISFIARMKYRVERNGVDVSHVHSHPNMSGYAP